GKTKGARSRTHGSDRKARPVTNYDGRRTSGVWGSDRREDTGMWGGVEGGTRVGADRRRPPHGAEGLRQCGLVPPPGQVGWWLGGAGGVQNGANRGAAAASMAVGWG